MNTEYDIRDPLGSCHHLMRTLLEVLLLTEFELFRAREMAAGRAVQKNGFAKKTVRGRFGEFEISVPRDRGGMFAPRVLPKGKILLGELESLFFGVYAGFAGPERFSGRLRGFLFLLTTVYGDGFTDAERRALLFALVRGCRSHREWLASLRYEPGRVWGRYRFYGTGFSFSAAPAVGWFSVWRRSCFNSRSVVREDAVLGGDSACDVREYVQGDEGVRADSRGESREGLLERSGREFTQRKVAVVFADSPDTMRGFPEWSEREFTERRIAGVNDSGGGGVSARVGSYGFGPLFGCFSPLATLVA